MKRFLAIVIVILSLLTTACSEKKSAAERIQEKLGIEGIENITGSMSGGWVVTLRVRNETAYTPVLNKGEGDLYCDNVLTAHASIMAPVTIPKKGIHLVDVPLEIKLHNPLRAISLLVRLGEKHFEAVEIAFDSEIEVMGIKKHFGSPRVAATELLNSLGASK